MILQSYFIRNKQKEKKYAVTHCKRRNLNDSRKSLNVFSFNVFSKISVHFSLETHKIQVTG